MKRRIITLSVLFLFIAVAVSAQTAKGKETAIGIWKFEAPYAPEGFTTGTIEFAYADDKYSSSISFTGNEYKIPGENTKIVNDTVTFTVQVEGNEVNITLKPEEKDKMTGKAATYDGEIPLTLTRDVPKK